MRRRTGNKRAADPHRQRSVKEVKRVSATTESKVEQSSPTDNLAPSTSTLPAKLHVSQILFGCLLVTFFGGISMALTGQYDLAWNIGLACTRAALQLFLLGGLILQNLFGTTRPSIVWAWIVGVGILAAQEAASRVEYAYEKLGLHMTFSLLSSGVGILSLALAGRVFGEIDPWFQPRTLIPTAGMLFGNTLPAASLAASSLTKEFARSSAQIELRLACGASAQEAVMPLMKSSLSSALTPTVNSLAATGIVHMPGMMTGQVLSGQSPSQAAAYQILILFLITSTACSTVQILSHLVSRELMNMEEVRLQTAGLVRVTGAKKFSMSSPIQAVRGVVTTMLQSTFSLDRSELPLSPAVFRVPTVEPINTSSMKDQTSHPVLKIQEIHVKRTNMTVSLILGKHDKLCVTGTTGIGKTQLLKSITGLEHSEGYMELKGERFAAENMGWPAWRRKVSWVSQDRTTLDGSPRDFFIEVHSFHSQKRGHLGVHPEEIGALWGLPSSSFDRPWSTLSGGEAQRASLAIAVSLEPDVLLLDEITAGLDEETQVAVEATLEASEIPIILVTHSQAQLKRFCTHHLDLDEAKEIR